MAKKQAESQGFAQVQDPNGPDQLDANNTGRVGDAREYLNGPSAGAAAQVQEGYETGQVAPEARYLTLDGRVVTEAGDGFRGTLLVAQGAVVTAAQADQLKG